MNLIIWGIGVYAKRVIEHIAYINAKCIENIYEVDCFVDSDPILQGTKFNGKMIISPDEIIERKTPIVIGVKCSSEIEKVLREKYKHKYYTYCDFVYRDLPLEENVELYDNYEIKEKLLLQNDILKGQYNYYDFNNYIAGIMCVFSDKLYDFGEKKQYYQIDSKNRQHIEKKIALYYHRMQNGGIERVMSHLMREFLAKGYEVFLLVDELDVDKDYEIPVDVRIHRTVVKEYENIYRWFLDVIDYLKQNKIDCLISHESYWYGNYYLYQACRNYNIKFILEIHNHYSGFIGGNLNFYKQLYSNADDVVVLTDEDALFWGKNGIQCTKICNPVYTYEKNKITNKKNILWIGRIALKQKKVLDVIKVAKCLIENHIDVRLHMVGKFENKVTEMTVKSLVEEYDLKDVIYFEGYQKDAEKYYREADIMILTSEYEGFPMVVAEAMGHAIPVVAYDLPYLELFKNKKGVICVEQGDFSEMSKQITYLLENDDLRRCIADEAHEEATRFSRMDLMKQWEELLNESN